MIEFPESQTKRTLGDRAFSVAALTVWNIVPDTIWNIRTLDNFNGWLKTHLFNEAFNCLIAFTINLQRSTLYTAGL